MWKMKLGRTLVLVVAILTMAVELAYFPSSLTRALTNWQATSSYPAVKGVMSYEAYALLIALLGCLVTTLFWIAAGVVFFDTGFRGGEGRGDVEQPFVEGLKVEGSSSGKGNLTVRLVATLVLTLLPPVFILSLTGVDPGLPAPWAVMVMGASFFLSFLALPVIVHFYFIFPDGRFPSHWMRWTVLALLAVLVILFGLLLTDNLPVEWGYLASMLLLLGSLLFGVGVLVYRHRKARDPGLKRQMPWPIIGLASVPASLLASIRLSESAWSAALPLWIQILLPALLPIGLLLAIYRHGLWRDVPTESPRWGKPILAWSFALAWVVGLGWFIWNVSRPAGEKLAFEPHPPSTAPRPVVIDTDMAPDDWMAILYLLQRPDIAVKAITVVGTGETHCEPGVRNALKLIKLAGAGGIPVACGRETPLQGKHTFPDNLRERADTLNWMTLPDGESPSPRADAVDLMIQKIGESPEKVSLLALGPLTNLAEAVQRDPGWLENLAQVYVMGGALKVEGNVGFFGIDNHLAEWNFYVDPAAVKIVLESGAPLTLVSLDATSDVPVDLAFFNSLKANHTTPEAQFVYEMLVSQLDFIVSGGYFFWDPLAAAVLVDEDLAEIAEGKMAITTEEGQRSGVTRLLPEGTPIRYAASADGARFREEFLRTLNQP